MPFGQFAIAKNFEALVVHAEICRTKEYGQHPPNFGNLHGRVTHLPGCENGRLLRFRT